MTSGSQQTPECRGTVAQILSRARDANGETDHSVVHELVAHGSKVVALLLEALGGEDVAAREVAAIALGELGDRSAIPALREAALVRIHRENMIAGAYDAQIEAIVALGRLRATEALDDLIWLMHYGLESDTTLAQLAIDALGHIGDARAIPQLLMAEYHAHPDTGRDVRRALDHIRMSSNGDVAAEPSSSIANRAIVRARAWYPAVSLRSAAGYPQAQS